MKTQLHEGFSGWRASTKVILGAGRVLNISTGKCKAGLVSTTALVSNIEGMFEVSNQSDFQLVLSRTRHSKCFKKAVRLQHDAALKKLKSIKAQALSHYKG